MAGIVIKGEPQTSSALNSSNVRINMDGIFEGDFEPLRVTAQDTPDMTVQVEGDNDRAYVSGNTALDYAGGNSGTFSNPPTTGYKKIDILTLDSSGTLGITAGTEHATTPVPPTYPSDKIVLAEIYLREGGTVIKNTDDSTNGYIYKARTPLFNMGTSLSDSTPQDLGTASAGTGTSASRDDHVHNTSLTLSTEQAASGTAIDFTGFPAGTKHIIIMPVGVSLDGGEEVIIQIGDAGGVETSGYLSNVIDASASLAATTGFILVRGGAAANILHGAVELFLEDSSDFTWVSSSNINDSNGNNVFVGAGRKLLSAELTTVRITSTGTPDDFDTGVFNVYYE